MLEHSLCLEDLGIQARFHTAPTVRTGVTAGERELPVTTPGPEPDASVPQSLPLNLPPCAPSSFPLPHWAAHRALRIPPYTF